MKLISPIRSSFDVNRAREQFPSLGIAQNGKPVVFLDNPGGTQVPQAVIDAVSNYYREANANYGGGFLTSDRTDEAIAAGREAMAALLNAPSPDCIVFGPNMTSLTFQVARAIARTIEPGDEVIVTSLDHDANVAPWLDLAEAGAVIKIAEFDPADGRLHPEAIGNLLSPRTRLVAVTHASNALGVVPDVREIVRLARSCGALTYVDAVQFAPHGLIDVQDLDCDFLACSAYKFFGPHVGILTGKPDLLRSLKPYKVRPASDDLPHRWETGTQNHEGIAGTAAAVQYLASLAQTSDQALPLRSRLSDAMSTLSAYESHLARELVAVLLRVGVTIHGPTEWPAEEMRLATVAFTWDAMSPSETAARLAGEGIFCWNGNYYAVGVMDRLGLAETGGAVRIGLVHYNTLEEINRLEQTLVRIRDRRQNRE